MQFICRKQLMAVLGLSFTAFLVCSSSSQMPAYAADARVLPFTANTIADIAEKATPAVVHLEMRRKISMNMAGLPPVTEFYFNGQKMQIPNIFGTQGEEDAPSQNEQTPRSGQSNPLPEQYSAKPDIASGFIIRPDGYIVTNAHAVDGQDKIKVTLADKRSYEA
ncbi:MAG: hypothetical protein K2X27_13985, partial [Candidatus Obscuribacterales bacterium]|nr:hypothetical protein [Candidatus Obscuribacterales bacterium]